MMDTPHQKIAFLVDNPEESERLQKELFSLGYRWNRVSSSGDQIRSTLAQFICINGGGNMVWTNSSPEFLQEEGYYTCRYSVIKQQKEKHNG